VLVDAGARDRTLAKLRALGQNERERGAQHDRADEGGRQHAQRASSRRPLSRWRDGVLHAHDELGSCPVGKTEGLARSRRRCDHIAAAIGIDLHRANRRTRSEVEVRGEHPGRFAHRVEAAD